MAGADEPAVAVVYAKSAAEHQVAANASAAGGKVAAGGSFDITILNDSAIARLSHSVEANGIYVGADSTPPPT